MVPGDSHFLEGGWTATIGSQANAARLTLAPHPDWQGMVKGEAVHDGAHHAMVGDANEGHVTLEESANGTNISATWFGTVTEGSCAREIHGHYQAGDDAPLLPFVLRKRTP